MDSDIKNFWAPKNKRSILFYFLKSYSNLDLKIYNFRAQFPYVHLKDGVWTISHILFVFSIIN